jgi:hypothetical protein
MPTSMSHRTGPQTPFFPQAANRIRPTMLAMARQHVAIESVSVTSNPIKSLTSFNTIYAGDVADLMQGISESSDVDIQLHNLRVFRRLLASTAEWSKGDTSTVQQCTEMG